MPSVGKASPLQLVGWCLAVLLGGAPLLQAIETEAELEATREALGALEQQQLQRLREIERLEELVADAARRGQQLREERRKLAVVIDTQDRAVAEQEGHVERQERELAAARRQAGQLLRGQWLRDRHQGRIGGDHPAWHHRELDTRIQAQREQALNRIGVQLQALSAARDRLAEARDQLLEQAAAARDLQREIERQEAEQAALLTRVEEEVAASALEMERLERNAETLERVLRRMRETPPPSATAAPPDAGEAATPFASRRGSLPRPVEGERLHRYGTARGGGLHSRWRGDVFAVGDDSPVRAVHAGHAVFADWMRGYGFLVIVEHGDGYLTLYGNNRELLARQGDTVAAGDVIARAGGTSIVIAPGLYFELRHRGETLNPGPWWQSK